MINNKSVHTYMNLYSEFNIIDTIYTNELTFHCGLCWLTHKKSHRYRNCPLGVKEGTTAEWSTRLLIRSPFSSQCLHRLKYFLYTNWELTIIWKATSGCKRLPSFHITNVMAFKTTSNFSYQWLQLRLSESRNVCLYITNLVKLEWE